MKSYIRMNVFEISPFEAEKLAMICKVQKKDSRHFEYGNH